MRKLFSISCLLFFFALSANAQTESVTFFVDGICGMCKDRIEGVALEIKGVESADWNVEVKQLTVNYDSKIFKLKRLHREIAYAGHDTEMYTAPEESYNNLHACCKYRDAEVIASHSDSPEGNETSIFVNGVCGMCKDRIEKAAKAVPGVKSATWDSHNRMLDLDVDRDVFSEDQLHWAVTAAGHDTREWLAPDDVYNNLADCCKYRELGDPVPAEDHDHDDHEGHDHDEETGVIEDIDREDLPASGTIYELTDEGELLPLIGVNIYWEDTKKGTSTDENGKFELKRKTDNQLLVVSYVGYEPDTIDMSGQAAFELTLSNAVMLEEVEVSYRQKSSAVSFVDPIKTLQIDERELLKAACCNLSESFETNPSVDVSFTDAVTGTRQIQMLGLAGPYVQITQELLPGARALSSIQGLTYIPGPWMSGIQLIKGPGSVVQGFESMTGQINVELKKPNNSERFYLNLYGNEGGRMEANMNSAIQLNKKVSTGILLHGSLIRRMNDRNEDGFLDNPIGNNLIAINRWKFDDMNNWEGQFGVKATLIDKGSGQMSDSYEEQISPNNPLWTATSNTDRLEVWAKAGRIFPEKPGTSIGLQASGVMHRQTSTFGIPGNDNFTNYISNQNSLYFNSIYQSDFGSATHQYKAGFSLQYDNIQESFTSEAAMKGFQEFIPGVYMEYTYMPTERLTVVAGMRGDYSTIYGAFATPRLFLRYAPAEETVIRASAGRGQRRPAIFMEQIGGFASNRSIVVQPSNVNDQGENTTPYGLDPEVSWNLGLNFTQNIYLADRSMQISADAYRTFFEKQVIADYDTDSQSLFFYNLEGKSYSNSLQLQVDYELLPRLDVRLAYRFNDVKMTFQEDGLLEKPFVARNRAFVNASYETIDGWAFDATLNWQGSKRIPNHELLAERSPSFFLLNGQISKSWNRIFDVYVGVENALNFRQDNPILSVEDPTSDDFDASLIWGPIFGRNIYAGIRYRFE
ncbi:MAG: TonB-dependent receptor [Bacteroidetes bacterium]|nr:TonB-dependent receptor [Bacteroidota bacterium]